MGVVQADEVLAPQEHDDNHLARTVTSLTAPRTGKRLQNRILGELQQRAERKEYNWTLSTLARRYGINPRNFSEVVYRAFDSPTHVLHDFSLEIFRHWAEGEEYLFGKMLDAADAKDRFEGWATGLERTRPEQWRRPSQSAATQVLQVGVVEKLQMLAHGEGTLATRD